MLASNKFAEMYPSLENEGISCLSDESTSVPPYTLSCADLKAQVRVFVGVDVFGRGCYGGGGYNCGEVSLPISYLCY